MKLPAAAAAVVAAAVAAAAAVVVAVRGCLLEIADVQTLSQGDCQAKNLTVSRILYVRTYIAALR